MNQPLTRWDMMKIIGLVLMFIDHAGYFYFVEQEWIRGIGRACAPIFFFLAAFAPHFKRDMKLVLFAVLLTFSDWWVKGGPNTLNILWTILALRLLFAWLESKGRFALKLHEWLIGAIVLIPSVLLIQYGTLGLMVALAGYVFKHKSHYKENVPQRFLLLSTALYGALVCSLSSFGLLTIIFTAMSLALYCALVMWFVRAPTTAVSCPAGLITPLKLASKHTALIYVAHLIALNWMTGKPI